MKTDVMTITGDIKGRKDALAAADKFIEYNELTGRNALHIRLLIEETVSMVHGILDGFTGSMWLESSKTEEGKLCRICVSARKLADEAQESKLLSVASSGKNESARGILGKLRDMFRQSLQHSYDGVVFDRNTSLNTWYGLGVSHTASSSEPSSPSWSLNSYRYNLEAESGRKTAEWDELERSVVANIADDIKVWLKSDSTEIVIEKLIKYCK